MFRQARKMTAEKFLQTGDTGRGNCLDKSFTTTHHAALPRELSGGAGGWSAFPLHQLRRSQIVVLLRLRRRSRLAAPPVQNLRSVVATRKIERGIIQYAAKIIGGRYLSDCELLGSTETTLFNAVETSLSGFRPGPKQL